MTQPSFSEHSTGRQCSLCGYVSDTKGQPPRVKTKGGWVAHEECVATVPSVRAEEDTTA